MFGTVFLFSFWKSPSTVRNNFKPYVIDYHTFYDQMQPDDPADISGVGYALGNYLAQWYPKSQRAVPLFGFNGNQVAILAHSMGGLVARSMMAYGPNINRNNVSILVTLATPRITGTPLANEYAAGGFDH